MVDLEQLGSWLVVVLVLLSVSILLRRWPRQGLADRFERLASWSAQRARSDARVRRRPGRERRAARDRSRRETARRPESLAALAGHGRAHVGHSSDGQPDGVRAAPRADGQPALRPPGSRRTGRAGDECWAGRSRGARPRVARPPLALTGADSSPEGSRLPTSAATRVRRLSERQVTERSVLDQILDAALVAHVAYVRDGSPVVLPFACARDGDWLLLHGSTGAGLLQACAAGEPISVAITHVDGLVVARSTFDNSMNYRSAVVFGVPEVLADADQARALDVLVDHLLPGRTQEVRSIHAQRTGGHPGAAAAAGRGQRKGAGRRSVGRRGRWRGPFGVGRRAAVVSVRSAACGPPERR